MYHKAANMIHTIRVLMEDDEKFRSMLREMNEKYYHQTVTGAEIEEYISDYTGKDLTAFFNQYLRTTKIPVIHFQQKDNQIVYRYEDIVENFDMPVLLLDGIWIYPTQKWQALKGYQEIPKINPNLFILTKEN